jgi:transcriptional regulator GlxA family with amidase domain
MPANDYKIAILLFDNLLATSASMAIEMMQMAESYVLCHNRSAKRAVIEFVGIDNKVVRASNGFRLKPDITIANDKQFDLVHIPALWRNPRPALLHYKGYLPWLKNQVAEGALVSAVGTGCCFPAEAGVLDGQPATTHWHYFDRFKKDYPKVELKQQYFITHGGNIYCAASINAMAELVVYLIKQLYDESVANHVARNFFHEIRNLDKPIGYLSDQVHYHPDEKVSQAQIWLEDNFSKPIHISELANLTAMSSRNLNRRFQNALGKSPLKYLQELRLNHAKELLQKSNLSIAEIAALCGYQESSAFSKLFRARYQTSPSQYQDTVRSKLFWSIRE